MRKIFLIALGGFLLALLSFFLMTAPLRVEAQNRCVFQDPIVGEHRTGSYHDLVSGGWPGVDSYAGQVRSIFTEGGYVYFSGWDSTGGGNGFILDGTGACEGWRMAAWHSNEDPGLGGSVDGEQVLITPGTSGKIINNVSHNHISLGSRVDYGISGAIVRAGYYWVDYRLVLKEFGATELPKEVVGSIREFPAQTIIFPDGNEVDVCGYFASDGQHFNGLVECNDRDEPSKNFITEVDLSEVRGKDAPLPPVPGDEQSVQFLPDEIVFAMFGATAESEGIATLVDVQSIFELPYVIDQRVEVGQILPNVADCHDSGQVQNIVWHQIASAYLKNNPDEMDGVRLAKAFRDARGWDRPGYQLLVSTIDAGDGFTKVFQLQNLDCTSYGVSDVINNTLINIAYVDFPLGSPPSDAQLKTMLTLTQTLLHETGLSPEAVKGHKEYTGSLNPNSHSDPVGVNMDEIRSLLGSGSVAKAQAGAEEISFAMVREEVTETEFARLEVLEEVASSVQQRLALEQSATLTWYPYATYGSLVFGLLSLVLVAGRKTRTTGLLGIMFALLVFVLATLVVQLMPTQPVVYAAQQPTLAQPTQPMMSTIVPPPTAMLTEVSAPQSKEGCEGVGVWTLGTLISLEELLQVDYCEAGLCYLNKVVSKENIRQHYDEIINRSVEACYSPAFTMAHYIEETAAGNCAVYPDSHDFGVLNDTAGNPVPGCNPKNPAESYERQLAIFLQKWRQYESDGTFTDCRGQDGLSLREWMLLYSGGFQNCRENAFNIAENYDERIQAVYSLITGGARLDFEK